ncbi:hypothetical protein JX265_003238 [Neoarthrinium moseri]|uniref:Glutaredoxin domain-containing protein n=1 Tax=Neoarthrinium moseri TaxID=1658444 RepID=A0A9P9WUA6_9PEZI|nr:uncharacterized protein JN550_005522 [Neoarthrinium moseri]KAI1869932.1 hypothetical protein JN550_005522 [Neoarthrinium moseri]KAI1879061.1 hypothetical protein JX265_003238 [Neoarthrinium moseri]
MSAAKELAQKYIDENAVAVFEKTWCPYCQETKATLKALKANVEFIQLDKRDDGSAIQDALVEISGQRSVPNIFINKKHIGGNSDLQETRHKGKLDDLLKEANAL